MLRSRTTRGNIPSASSDRSNEMRFFILGRASSPSRAMQASGTTKTATESPCEDATKKALACASQPATPRKPRARTPRRVDRPGRWFGTREIRSLVPTLVPIRPRSRGERRSLRTFAFVRSRFDLLVSRVRSSQAQRLTGRTRRRCASRSSRRIESAGKRSRRRSFGSAPRTASPCSSRSRSDPS